MCFFSFCVCVFFYWSAPGDLSKDDYHKNKHTLPSPTQLCFLPQNSPKQNKYENINPICSFRSESDFWGNLYGFWRLLFIFTSFGVVWVCSLLSDFYFYHILSPRLEHSTDKPRLRKQKTAYVISYWWCKPDKQLRTEYEYTDSHIH